MTICTFAGTAGRMKFPAENHRARRASFSVRRRDRKGAWRFSSAPAI